MSMPNGNTKLPSGVDGNARGPAMHDFDLASAVRSDACVLLTGKRDAAQAMAYRIHSLSGWRHGPFTIVDCGWPEAIVESGLLGVFAETGTPTWEPHPRLAQAGTVLLQDVWRLGPAMQCRLADRLMQWRVGRMQGRPRRRLMASSSEPLLPRVLEGTFDDRLFYRLNVIHVVIPSEPTTADFRGVSGVDGRILAGHGSL